MSFVVVVVVVGLGVTLWLGQIVLAVLVGLALLVYLWLLLQDVAGLNQALAGLLAVEAGGQRPSAAATSRGYQQIEDNSIISSSKKGRVTSAVTSFAPQTYYGRQLLGKLQALRYRLAAEHWNAAMPEIESLDLLKDIEEADLSNNVSIRENIPPLYARILQLLRDNFRAAAQAVVVAPEGSSLSSSCYSAGRFGADFETYLIRAVEGHFAQGDSSCIGLQDCATAKHTLEALQKYGIRYSICYPFLFVRQGKKQQALIWLGYTDSQPPFEVERNRAEHFASKLSQELKSSGKLYELVARAQQAEDQSRKKSEYIAHVSHDIRSPLNNIKSILSLLRCEAEQQPTIQELIEIALTNCGNLAEIVEDILDYTKHQAGQLQPRFEIFSLAQIVNEVVASFSIAARMKNLDLIYQQDSDNSYLINADKRQVKRIISNLVSNAIKYTRLGEIEISLLSSGSGHCVLTVRDTGIGMSQQLLDNLFRPFQRGEHEGIEGIGLGLALAKILLELNCGKIVVASEQGQGSEFTVVFAAHQLAVKQQPRPQQQSEQVPVVEDQQLASSQQAVSFKTASLLLVDDDVDCVETLARNLKLAGFRVIKAVTMDDALKIVDFEKPDLIITDGKMPDGGAEKLLQTVKEKYSALPVIVVSGLSSAADRARFLALGADEVLDKPVDFDSLQAQIKVSLSQSGTSADKLSVSR